MRRITAIAAMLALLLLCAACGQGTEEVGSASEWTFIAGGQESASPLAEEEESGNGLITIEGIYRNTQFSTEYQYLLYVVYDITNDSDEDIPIPAADPGTGTGSAAALRLGGSDYEDLYPFNDWMRQSIEETDAFLSSGDGTVIPAGSRVRMISCFQVDTAEVEEEAPMKLVFRSGTTRLSADANFADIQRVSDTEALLEKIQ